MHCNDESCSREMESWDVLSLLDQGRGLLGTLFGQDSLVEMGAASRILGLTNSTQPSLEILL